MFQTKCIVDGMKEKIWYYCLCGWYKRRNIWYYYSCYKNKYIKVEIKSVISIEYYNLKCFAPYLHILKCMNQEGILLLQPVIYRAGLGLIKTAQKSSPFSPKTKSSPWWTECYMVLSGQSKDKSQSSPLCTLQHTS